jgi:uncharacterized protein
MGMAKFIVSAFTVGIVAFGTLHAAHATALKGTQAFQRGKYEDALKYLKPAADAGDAGAMYVLGQMYASGRGIKKDEKMATDYFLRSAELGNAAAQQSLGSALMLGEGIKQDMVEALKWFIISARAGNKGAQAYTKKVGGFLSRDMQREARMKALDWKTAREKQKKAAEGN